jgi:hypothetical protein
VRMIVAGIREKVPVRNMDRIDTVVLPGQDQQDLRQFRAGFKARDGISD